MAVPESNGPSASSGLFGSLRSFWSVLIAILHTRLDLVSTELEDEAVRAVKLAIAGVISLLALFAAFFWANFFIVALAWGTPYEFWVIGGIFALYFGIGVILFAVARNMILNRPKFLSQTIAELRRDVEGLTRAIPARKEETKP